MLALKSKVYNPTFQSRVYMERMFFYYEQIFFIGYISEKEIIPVRIEFRTKYLSRKNARLPENFQ